MPVGELAAWLDRAGGALEESLHAAAADHRRRGAEGAARPASASCSTSACIISRSTAPPRPSPAARPSASAWPGRSAAAWSASSTSSTSRASACTRATTTGCCAAWNGCATWATPSSSSSTTRTPCGRPITSSISAPAPACAAARSSPPGRMPRSLANPNSLTGQYLTGARSRSPIPQSAGRPPAAQLTDRRGPAPQPQEHHRRDPARAVRLRHRRQRLGQKLAGQRHPAGRRCWRTAGASAG